MRGENIESGEKPITIWANAEQKFQIKFKASKQNTEVILSHGSSLPH